MYGGVNLHVRMKNKNKPKLEKYVFPENSYRVPGMCIMCLLQTWCDTSIMLYAIPGAHSFTDLNFDTT